MGFQRIFLRLPAPPAGKLIKGSSPSSPCGACPLREPWSSAYGLKQPRLAWSRQPPNECPACFHSPLHSQSPFLTRPRWSRSRAGAGWSCRRASVQLHEACARAPPLSLKGSHSSFATGSGKRQTGPQSSPAYRRGARYTSACGSRARQRVEPAPPALRRPQCCPRRSAGWPRQAPTPSPGTPPPLKPAYLPQPLCGSATNSALPPESAPHAGQTESPCLPANAGQMMLPAESPCAAGWDSSASISSTGAPTRSDTNLRSME